MQKEIAEPSRRRNQLFPVSSGFVADSLCRESNRRPFAPSSANKLRRDIASQRGNPPFRFRDSLGTSSFAVDFSTGYRVGQFRMLRSTCRV